MRSKVQAEDSVKSIGFDDWSSHYLGSGTSFAWSINSCRSAASVGFRALRSKKSTGDPAFADIIASSADEGTICSIQRRKGKKFKSWDVPQALKQNVHIILLEFADAGQVAEGPHKWFANDLGLFSHILKHETTSRKTHL